MITQCLNSACRVPFSHSQNGRFFTVDLVLTSHSGRQAGSQSEQYWLCETCSKSLKVVIEDNHITTAPIEVETASLVR